MRELHLSMNHLILYGFVSEEKPFIHGFSSKEKRDKSFEQFKESGELELHDESIGVSQTFEPLFAFRADVVDGLSNINVLKSNLKGTKSNE